MSIVRAMKCKRQGIREAREDNQVTLLIVSNSQKRKDLVYFLETRFIALLQSLIERIVK